MLEEAVGRIRLPVAAALLCSFSAVAMSAEGTGLEDRGSAGDAAASEGLEEVVVTAQKRVENIQKTAAAVTAVSGESLVMSGITDLPAASALVPSARFQVEGQSTQVFLRGVGSNLDYVNIDQTVAFNFNNVYIPREGTSASFFDISQFEVLPGPQGTLYGRSALGGTVNVNFNRPSHSWETDVVLETGDYDLAHLTAVQNVPVTADFSVRAAVDYTYHSGYDTSGADSANNIAARISGLYSMGSGSWIYLWAYGEGKNGNVPNLVNRGTDPATGTFSPNAYLHSNNPWNDTYQGSLAQFAIFGQPQPQNIDYENYAIGGEAQFALGGNVTLTYIPSYFYLKEDYIQWDSAITQENDLHIEQLTQELRLAGDVGKLTWLAGVYGYRVKSAQLVKALLGTPAEGTYGNITGDEEKGVAEFGQVTYSILEPLRLTVGGRYSIDQRIGAGFSPDTGAPFNFDGTFRHFDYKAGFEYDLAAGAMAYASFQTAYQPGTYEQFAATPGQSNRVEPATLHAVTAGIKSQLLDRRVQVNNEVFSYDYHNFFAQAFDNNLHFNPLFNAKKVRIYGDELKVTVRPTPDDLINTSVAWTHARNVDFTTPSGQNFDGLSPAYAADWTAGFSLQHNFRLSSGGFVALEGDARYESSFWADYAHSPGLRQPASTKGNASVTYHSQADRWTAGLWVKNISNVAVMAAGASGGIPGPANVYLQPPRTYGVRFTYNQ